MGLNQRKEKAAYFGFRLEDKINQRGKWYTFPQASQTARLAILFVVVV